MGKTTEYRGYRSDTPLVSVIKSYEQRIGESPTLIVVPETYTRDIPEIPGTRIVFSHTTSIILATHKTRDWTEIMPNSEPVCPDPITTRPRMTIPQPKVGRPSRPEGICPHCRQRVKDYNDLGHWWGWQYGIEPDYWNNLRIHTFRRDNYTCQRCHSRLPVAELICHHIHPKERHGIDGARNLITMCHPCHNYLHDANDKGTLEPGDEHLIFDPVEP